MCKPINEWMNEKKKKQNRLMELATVLYFIGARYEYKGPLLLLRLQPKGQSFVKIQHL